MRVLGSRNNLDPTLAKSLDSVEERTKSSTHGTLSLCVNYGGRRDIVNAFNRMLADDSLKAVDETSFGGWLSTAGLPDPDLIIRTSGEHRLSNFMLWEGAYSELYFADVLWPDFDEAQLDLALKEYQRRQRNFGA